jgi:hypothetical protein
MPGWSGNPKGGVVQKQRLEAKAKELAVEIARLKDELGHEASPSELLLIEVAASATVAARQCRCRPDIVEHLSTEAS